MNRDPLTRSHAVFLQSEAARRGDWDCPYLADEPLTEAEVIQAEADLIKATEPLWQSALVIVIWFAFVAVMVMA